MDPADQAEPPAELLTVAARVVPRWLRECVVRTAAHAGVEVGDRSDEIDRMADDAAARLLDALRTLLATDVDEQRTNPLSLFRSATAAPTALLRSFGVPPIQRDRFAIEQFPDDHYGLIPASWADIDPAMHEPGIAWGAWKALTVLRRRRQP